MADFFVNAGLLKETGIFNPGRYSINDIIKSIDHVIGLKTDVKYIGADIFSVKEVFLDMSKATKIFGWKLMLSLEEGMIMYCKWM